ALRVVGGGKNRLARVRAGAAAAPEVAARLIPAAQFGFRTRLTSDDWPYLYLPRPTLPRYHVGVALAAIGLAVLLAGRVRASDARVDAVMLLLGAGFMLLEVSGVSRAALLFGT